MSQVATKRRIEIHHERVDVTARFTQTGSVLRGDQRGRCSGIQIDVTLDSPAPPAVVAQLLRAAHRMCFAESALRECVPVESTHRLNGERLEVERASEDDP